VMLPHGQLMIGFHVVPSPGWRLASDAATSRGGSGSVDALAKVAFLRHPKKAAAAMAWPPPGGQA